MNRHQRRAQAAKAASPADKKAEAIRLAMLHLAHAAPTATGGTLFFADGTRAYLSADDARALYGTGKPEGTA